MSSKYLILADVCPFVGNQKTGWPMAVTKVRALEIRKKSFMSCPHWSGFVEPLSFSDSGCSLVLPVTSSKSNKRNCQQLLTCSLLTHSGAEPGTLLHWPQGLETTSLLFH
jgi:hypothetical protein